MAGKAAKKKQNLEMYDALESTINRVTDQAQKFRRKMDELVSKLLLSLWDLSPQLQKLFLPPLKKQQGIWITVQFTKIQITHKGAPGRELRERRKHALGGRSPGPSRIFQQNESSGHIIIFRRAGK